uniref:Strawberry notch AAA domain-containing protein n=1 Tax=Meloidogyne floridensis TaxID=298350 RepID=A0A915PAE7_9BILA
MLSNKTNHQTNDGKNLITSESNPEQTSSLDEPDTLQHSQSDTFINYKPPRLRCGLEHPDEVVETLSLSSVSSPEIRYTLAISDELIDSGKISALQLEAVLYACQAHERFLPSGERCGYLIGLFNLTQMSL